MVVVGGANGRAVVETARLRLRRLTPEDAAFVLELLNEPGFLQFVGDRDVRTVEQARAYIVEVFAASYEALGFGLYHVSVTATGEAVGLCGLVKRAALSDVDVGFAFLERTWGRGYASEAAAAVLDYAYGTLKIPRVIGITAPDNWASMAVLQKVGLKPAGTVKLPGYELERRVFTPEGR
jgi:RimJ/RimL family protein N-acetyltransferase